MHDHHPALSIPEFHPRGGRVLSIHFVGHPRVRQFVIPMNWVMAYREVVREAARAKRTYWVDLNDSGVFDLPNLGYDDSVPLRILKVISNGQIVPEDESA